MYNRRDFLKTSVVGAGALTFAPSWRALASEHASNQPGFSFPKRFVFIRKSNGTHPHDLILPTFSDELKRKDNEKEAFETTLDKHDLPPFLAELDGYKDQMTILQGLSSKMSLNGHNVWHSVMGLFRAFYGEIEKLSRVSIDYELAKLFPSPLGHVELSFAADRFGIVPGFSVPAPYETNFCYADPITAYENLFQCVLNPEKLASDNAMLAHLQKSEAEYARSKAGADQRAYEVHARSVGAIQDENNELAKMATKVARHMPDREVIYEKGKQSASLLDRQDAMTEVLVGALASGLTNVVTYTIDDLATKQTGYPGIESIQFGLHSVGHNQSYGGKSAIQLRDMIRTQHIKQVKTIVDKLKAQPEGNGTMFDNTMVMYFPEGGEKHHAHGTESPWVILSGNNTKLDVRGRYIRLPYHMTEGHKTLGNWYTTLLNANGNPMKHYGDLDPEMMRAKMPQEGAIKRFIGS